jgi:hypothetical protein
MNVIVATKEPLHRRFSTTVAYIYCMMAVQTWALNEQKALNAFPSSSYPHFLCNSEGVNRG